MRTVGFWMFQSGALLSAFVYFWLLVAPLHNSDVTAQQSQQTDVLGRTHVTFHRPAGRAPDPAKIHEQINRRRTEAGLPRLTANTALAELAYQRAADMQNAEYYAHENPESGKTFVDGLQSRAVDYRFTCENLNLAFIRQERATTQAWLDSKNGHRECLLHETISQAGYAVVDAPFFNDKESYIIVAIYTAL